MGGTPECWSAVELVHLMLGWGSKKVCVCGSLQNACHAKFEIVWENQLGLALKQEKQNNIYEFNINPSFWGKLTDSSGPTLYPASEFSEHLEVLVNFQRSQRRGKPGDIYLALRIVGVWGNWCLATPLL